MLEPVAGAGHVNNLAAVDEAVEDSGGNGGVAKEVGPLVKALVGGNNEGRLLSKRTHTKTRRTAALEREQQEADTRPPVFSYLQAAHR